MRNIGIIVWLFDHFQELLGAGLAGFVIVLLVIMFFNDRVFRLLTYYLDKRDKRHDFAKDLVEKNNLTEEGNQFLIESLEKEAFSRYYGIRADKVIRSYLISFHAANSKELKWIDISRAYPFMRFSQGELAIKIEKFNRYENRVYLLISYLSFSLLCCLWFIFF